MTRLTDIQMNRNYISNYNFIRSDLYDIQTKIASQQNVSKPSDNPSEIGSIMDLNELINSNVSYQKNIDNKFAQINESIAALETVYDHSLNIMSKLGHWKNTIVAANENETTRKAIELTLDAMLEMANTKFDGQYLFGGTDFSTPPVGFDPTDGVFSILSQDVSGEQYTRIAGNIKAHVNVSAMRVFMPVVKQSGNINSGEPVGFAYNKVETQYDGNGNEYQFDYTWTKTGANTFEMTYDVFDDAGASVLNGSHEIVFDPDTAEIASVDGGKPQPLNIRDAALKLDFFYDFASVRQTSGVTQLAEFVNQRGNPLTVLQTIKDNLAADIRPNNNQLQIIDDFPQVIVDQTTEAGELYNRLDAGEKILDRQDLVLQELRSKKQDVDMATAIMDLQSREYHLNAMYKLSSKLLPQSILDFM
jgi:flagellar hook-associated protein 3 FlgL